MKFTMAAILLSLSFSAFSKSITCEVSPMLADKGGYVMPGDGFKVSSEIQEIKDVDVKNCTKFDNDSRELLFCVTTAEFDGGYDIAVFNPETYDTSHSLFGTKQGKLVGILDNYDILSGVREKLNTAEIKFPSSYDGGDSLQIDDMVEEGVKKEVLNHNEVILYQISDCQLN